MGAGYRGRVGLFELMEVTDRISNIISAQVSEDQLRKTALLEGMVTLRDAGLEKIRQGVTSVEEILKRTTVTKSAVPAYLADPEVEQYENKAVIFREGNRGSDFFKLIKGELVVVRNGKKIADIMQPGEYFGEISAITGKPRSETVMSRGNSVVQRFPGDKLPEIIEKYPDITTKLLEINADRLNYAHNIIVNIMNKKMP
jgi:type IV pilus assembly protein PilB